MKNRKKKGRGIGKGRSKQSYISHKYLCYTVQIVKFYPVAVFRSPFAPKISWNTTMNTTTVEENKNNYYFDIFQFILIDWLYGIQSRNRRYFSYVAAVCTSFHAFLSRRAVDRTNLVQMLQKIGSVGNVHDFTIRGRCLDSLSSQILCHY